MRLYNRYRHRTICHEGRLDTRAETLAFLIKRQHATVVERQVSMRERAAGESYFTFSKSISYMATTCSAILFSLSF